ncbi:LysR family transcriptional regulator [Bordetella avium]|uniref:LysR family transcriptional regulator n=1 Tax=Bordetella avium TaxID=521 RepID=UPI00030A052A|nr:LysR family transcriptional regulator [Bordetella avium]AZY50866.1 LysR family transcriptional regulator [Bordetella avium]AZY54257.1 LysR family transcriptional regulator [Bordetella avium]RIQ14331.1 LysR family transcriptional regulator [Bordetella avium]RIQ18189.1 LysR family transcriptional regulator [Bordetella avium]RIQ36684.1 LysR family transcriptional regulator [Bordetella avium]
MQDINQARLRYFYEVVRCGSVRAAADKLDTAASVISRQIRLLEQELDVTLFERRGRGLAPTEAASMVLDYHQGCQAQHEHLAARLEALRGMRSGHVKIVISEGFIDTLMEQVIGPFCRRHPLIQLDVETASVNEVVELVASDAAHLGLAFNPPVDPRVRCRLAAVHPVQLLAAPNHALARQGGPITLQAMLAYPYALMSAPYGLRRIIDVVELTERIHLTPSLTTNSLRVLKQYVESGAGVTLMPALGAHRELAEGSLVGRAVEHPALTGTQCQMLVRTGRPLSDAALEILRQIANHLPVFRGEAAPGVPA